MASPISEADFSELEKAADSKTYESAWSCIYDVKPNTIHRRPVPVCLVFSVYV
jgi:hypothetical protein